MQQVKVSKIEVIAATALGGLDNSPGLDSLFFPVAFKGKEHVRVEFDTLVASAANHDLIVTLFESRDEATADPVASQTATIANFDPATGTVAVNFKEVWSDYAMIHIASSGTDTWTGNYTVYTVERGERLHLRGV